jgi:hypothetical protein
MGDNITNEKGILKEFPVFKVRQFRRLRREGIIPCIRIGPRLFLYDRDKVMAALRKMEVSG